jgi:uncharacterized sporulation protein YeaH/YhbH (DUF444 family)
MTLKIHQDHSRFKQIVRGKIRENLRQYITRGELIGKQGKDVVSIPLPQIEIPRLRFGDRDSGGVGQGEGEVGDAIGQGDGDQPGQGQKAGDSPGDHVLEVDVTFDELAELLGEELHLPRIEPRGAQRVKTVKEKYTGIRTVGPESLKHFKRTYREALRREIAAGTYNPQRPIIVPIRQDRRYRSWKEDIQPQSNAVIIYCMDVSGSMGDEQKEIVRIESFWIDTWLRHNYEGIESRYVIHDATAREVDRDTFYHTRESGGTMISTAYKEARRIYREEFPAAEWNVYIFHFSDGDNWSVDDTSSCIEMLRDDILPEVNLFCYGQVESPYGSGQFLKDLREHFGEGSEQDNLVTSEICDKDAIYDSIGEFLGTGR